MVPLLIDRLQASLNEVHSKTRRELSNLDPEICLRADSGKNLGQNTAVGRAGLV
jgi:hypothetical protein